MYAGQNYTINWSRKGSIGDVLIEYTTNNGESWIPVEPQNVGNSGSYDWLVPVVNSTQCLVRISDVNDPNTNDVSDDVFIIVTNVIRAVPSEYPTIQAAINGSNHFDIVIVSQGHYYENIDFKGKAITVTSTNPNDPNCVDNTIIDANGNGIVVSFHVDEDANSVLSGFTITGGRSQYGGGIACWGFCSPTITDCNISNNSAAERGGGVYCDLSHPTLTRCILTANSADHGGGMYNYGSSPTLTSCTFTANIAGDSGGGIYFEYGNAILANCVFNHNTAGRYGGGMYSDVVSNQTLTGCILAGNSANNGGGGMCSDQSYTTFTHCKLVGNYAKNGGGIYYWHSIDQFLTNCTLSGNSATGPYPDGYGGGIYCENSRSTVSNCTLAGNYAEEDGGGIYIIENAVMDPVPVIENSIICNSLSGSGIYAVYSDPLLLYNNVYGNIDGDYGGWAWPGEGDISDDPCFAEPGQWEDPCNTPGNMTDDVWVNGDYHLKSDAGRWNPNSEMWVLDNVTSPCIDSGEFSGGCSIDGEPSPNGGRINMGAYGGMEQASKSRTCWEVLECAGQCFGDATCDGKVNLADLFALKATFGLNAPWVGNTCCTDFTHDGSVNLGDLFRLKEGFGSIGYSPSTGNQSCPP